MSTPDTPTPRTDAEEYTPTAEINGPMVESDFARQLERELTAAKEENADLRLQLSQMVDDVAENDQEVLCGEAELALLRKRVEAADAMANAATFVPPLLNMSAWYLHAEALGDALAAYRATEGNACTFPKCGSPGSYCRPECNPRATEGKL